MEKEKFLKDACLESFCQTLFSMRMKMRDRDSTVLDSLQFESFEDFYEKYKIMFVFSYKDEDRLFKAIFRVFISGQLSCIVSDSTDRDIVQETVYEMVEFHYGVMRATLKKNWPFIESEIIKRNKNYSI